MLRMTQTMNSVNNIVIGAGVAGLSIAHHLAQRGERVTLIDQGLCGHETTAKAAGMITPASEVHLGEANLMRCFLESREYWKDFSNTLTGDSPELIDYQDLGSVLCAINPDGTRELARLYNFQKEMGFNVEYVSKTKLTELEPLLSPRVTEAVFAKNEAHVDTLKLTRVLKQNLLDSGLCDIIENSFVTVQHNGEKITGVTIGKEKIALTAKNYFLACGLKHGIDSLDNVVKLPLRGVKGQILTIQSTPGTLTRPVRVSHRFPVYLVPRSDGRIIVGATAEEKTDTDVTAGGMLDLIYAAWQVLPQLYDCAIVETVAGLRPAAPDHKPIFGTTPLKNLFVLTGLYRHGIMAAPMLARDLVMLALGGENKWEEFDLRRF